MGARAARSEGARSPGLAACARTALRQSFFRMTCAAGSHDVIDRTLPWLPRIDLAREPEFSLGPLKVRPSRREVEVGDVCQVLQPRIMQVLVALAHPSSEVVSQDELISRCWAGLSVGEDAVARGISQLRRVAAAWAEPPFQIETIPGVGYRMTPTAAAASTETASRRTRLGWTTLIGTVIVAAITVAAVVTLQPWRQAGAARSAMQPPSIAVLGFQSSRGTPEERGLAAALQGRVVDALSKYNLTVISAAPNAGALGGKFTPADYTLIARVTACLATAISRSRNALTLLPKRVCWDAPWFISGPTQRGANELSTAPPCVPDDWFPGRLCRQHRLIGS